MTQKEQEIEINKKVNKLKIKELRDLFFILLKSCNNKNESLDLLLKEIAKLEKTRRIISNQEKKRRH